MSAYDKWKAATVKKLKEPKAVAVFERHWKQAYIRNLAPDDAAVEIDRHYHNTFAKRPKKR
jgi:hypothetical protein